MKLDKRFFRLLLESVVILAIYIIVITLQHGWSGKVTGFNSEPINWLLGNSHFNVPNLGAIGMVYAILLLTVIVIRSTETDLDLATRTNKSNIAGLLNLITLCNAVISYVYTVAKVAEGVEFATVAQLLFPTISIWLVQYAAGFYKFRLREEWLTVGVRIFISMFIGMIFGFIVRGDSLSPAIIQAAVMSSIVFAISMVTYGLIRLLIYLAKLVYSALSTAVFFIILIFVLAFADKGIENQEE